MIVERKKEERKLRDEVALQKVSCKKKVASSKSTQSALAALLFLIKQLQDANTTRHHRLAFSVDIQQAQ